METRSCHFFVKQFRMGETLAKVGSSARFELISSFALASQSSFISINRNERPTNQIILGTTFKGTFKNQIKVQNGNKLTTGSLWVVTSAALELIKIVENPDAHHLWWHQQVFPFYRSMKRGGPGQWEERPGIGCFQRTESWGSCCQDVWQTPDDLIRGSH